MLLVFQNCSRKSGIKMYNMLTMIFNVLLKNKKNREEKILTHVVNIQDPEHYVFRLLGVL